MKLRDLKLAIASEVETEEVKSLNKFFDDLFSDILMYTDGVTSDLIFMKGNKCIMKQHLQYGCLFCIYDNFWKVLETKYDCSEIDIRNIIQYKVEEYFNTTSLIPCHLNKDYGSCLEEIHLLKTQPHHNSKYIIDLVEMEYANTRLDSSRTNIYEILKKAESDFDTDMHLIECQQPRKFILYENTNGCINN